MSDITLKARLVNAQQANTWLNTAYATLKPYLIAGHVYDVSIKPETRSTAQNRLMCSCLTDLSEQVLWDGKRQLTKEGWKDYLTAHLSGQDLVPNMDGTGFVAIGRGKSTSEMTKAELTAVIDLAHAFGDGRDVKWSKTSLGQMAEYA
jgi:hypothetical protein